MKQLLITLLCLSITIPAFSCFCAARGFCHYYEKIHDNETTLIFEGSYITEEEISNGTKAVAYKVEKIYKGEIVTQNSSHYSGEKYINTNSSVWLLSGSDVSCLRYLDETRAIFIVTYNSGWPTPNTNVGYVPTVCETDYFPISDYNEITGWIWDQNEEVTIGLDEFEAAIEEGCMISSSEDSLEEFGQLNIFPNPVQDRLTVEAPSSIALNEIGLYDLQGRLVKNASGNTIDTNDLRPGIYFVKAKGLRSTHIKKIIKV